MAMNILNKVGIRSPNEVEGECAQFVIEDVTSPYLFGGVAKKGEKYTFSSYMRSEGNGSVKLGKQLLDVGTEWKRQFITFEASGTDVELYFNEPGTYYLFETQLEIGNTMTDWRPAVEDTEEDMKNLDNKFEEYATVTQLNSSIEASASEINATVSAVRTSIGELDTRVESTEARLELKVDSETLISEINASADVITLNGNRFVVNSDNLKITEDGTIMATDGVFSGDITCDEKIKIQDLESNIYGEMSIEAKTISSGIFSVDLFDGSIQSASSARNVKCFVISNENGLWVDGDAHCEAFSTLSVAANSAYITSGTFKDITASKISVYDCSVYGALAVNDISINGTKLTEMLKEKANKEIQAVTVSGVTEASYSTSVTTNTRAIPSLCLVILNDQVTLTLDSAITAGTTINLGTISSYKPGANVAVTIWQNSTQARRYMGVLTNKGTIEMKSNMDMPAGTYYIYIAAAYIW